MMKNIFYVISVALLTLTACRSDDENKAEVLTVEKLAGLWMAGYAEDKTEGDLHWTRVLEDYSFSADGTGFYECYLIDGNTLAGAESTRNNGALHYTISGNTVSVTLDKTSEKWELTYADGKLTDPERIVFQKATAAQQAEVNQWYAEWQAANSAQDDDYIQGNGGLIYNGVSSDDDDARTKEYRN